MSRKNADGSEGLFARLAIWLDQDFPPKVTSVESADSGADQQKSSYGLPATGADQIVDLCGKDPGSVKGLSARPVAQHYVALSSGLQASSRECACRPSTSQSAGSGAQPTTSC
jgi:hypothetical protein